MYLTVVLGLVLAVSAGKNKTTSVRKCCPPDYIFDQGRCNGSNETFVLPQIHTWPHLVPSNESVPNLSYGFPACNTFMYYLDPFEDPSEKFTLLETGWLVRGDGRKDPPGQYCFDVIAHENGVRPVVCFLGDDEEPEDPEAKGMFAVYPVGMLVSIPFLLVTFFVYAAIKQLRSLHGYCLMSHVAALIASYSSLIVVQIASSTMDIQFCILLAKDLQTQALISSLSLPTYLHRTPKVKAECLYRYCRHPPGNKSHGVNTLENSFYQPEDRPFDCTQGCCKERVHYPSTASHE